MKRLISILCVIVLIATTMSGCGVNNSQQRKITIWAYTTLVDSAEKAVEIYKKNHPDCEYEFEVVTYGQEDMVKKVKIALSTGAIEMLPDLFYDEDYNFAEYVTYYTDSFYDVTSYLNNEEFYEYKVVNATYNNKMYAIPYDSGTCVMFYRNDLIEKAGYTSADMNELTWSEYIKIGKKVEEATGIDMLVMSPERDMEGRLMYQSAGEWFFDENGMPNMVDPAFKDVFLTMNKAFEEGIVYGVTNWDGYIAALSNQKMASLIGASWWAPIISENENQSGLWRVTQIPRMEGKENYSNYSNLGGGSWFVINNEKSEFTASFATEMFAQNQELANYMADKYSLIPVNNKTAKNISTSNNEFFGNQNIADIFIEYNSNITPVRYGANTYEMTYTVGPIVAQYLKKEITVDEAIEKMQEFATNISNHE